MNLLLIFKQLLVKKKINFLSLSYLINDFLYLSRWYHIDMEGQGTLIIREKLLFEDQNKMFTVLE